MKPIMKWQREQIVKELLLLQAHAADPSCPCESEGEFCVRKHLLLIEAYSDESVPITDDEQEAASLAQLSNECRELRKEEEAKLCGQEVEGKDLVTWAREWRKQFEEPSIACELKEVAMSSNPHSLVYVDLEVKPFDRSRSEGVKALVDTGSHWCSLPRSLQEKLGLPVYPRLDSTILSDGTVTWPDWTQAIFALDGREGKSFATLTEDAEPAIGVILLEDLGFLVDPTSGSIEPLPPSSRHAKKGGNPFMSSNPGIGEALVTGAGIGVGLVVGQKVLEKKEGNPWTPPPNAVEHPDYYKIDGSFYSKLHGVALSPCEVQHGLGSKLDLCISKVEERNVEKGCPPEGLGTAKCPLAVPVCRASISIPVCGRLTESKE